MTPDKKTLVLKRSDSRFFPDDVKVGWRITCQNGDPYDMFWGACKPAALDSLIADVKLKRGDVDVLDLRDRPGDVRDGRYMTTP